MRYHNITKDDMLNGSGLRVVLWVSGCSHACKNCHNEITWDIQGGLVFDETVKAEVFAELEKDYIEGITLSGGDPLHVANRDDIASLIEEIHTRFPQKTIWLYTGYSFDDVKSLSCMSSIDVLVDGRYEEEHKDAQILWRGSSNQRIIDVQKSLQQNTVVLYEEK